jgi:hypothetical protein
VIASLTEGVLLPVAGGTLERYRPAAAPELPAPNGQPARSRLCYAAAHVVADPLADADPIDDARLDWDATLAYRRHLWSFGLGVAEAMDTAQRGMGLGWAAAQELIARTAAEARAVGGLLACGAGTDQLEPARAHRVDAIRDAYLEQCAFVAEQGATPVVMASRALAAAARSPDDYRAVYDPVLAQAGRPVILHWLGEVFDPALAGYWGASDPERAADLVCELIAEHAERVDGIKVSLLDEALEVSLRRRLPPGVRLYTGDDFNYLRLIRGDERGHSDALLGILDAIAPVASAALAALDEDDVDGYESLLAPTLPFARHVFGPPTRHYKTGLVFLAYLNGHQAHFKMIGGLEGARSILHLAELFRLADRARLLRDPELATARMRAVLSVAGVEP